MPQLTVEDLLVWLDSVQRAYGGSVPVWLQGLGSQELCPLTQVVRGVTHAGYAWVLLTGQAEGGKRQKASYLTESEIDYDRQTLLR